MSWEREKGADSWPLLSTGPVAAMYSKIAFQNLEASTVPTTTPNGWDVSVTKVESGLHGAILMGHILHLARKGTRMVFQEYWPQDLGGVGELPSTYGMSECSVHVLTLSCVN